VAGIVVMLVGFEPGQVLALLVKGAFGSKAGISYTLYYATTFVFTGLAVAVAFHGGLFNIGGEGQAMMGGLGAGLAALAWSAQLPGWLMLPIMVLSAALFGHVVGRHSGCAAGLPRQPHGHHDHHVQLHCSGVAELPARQHAEGARQHDARKPRVCRFGASAGHARADQLAGHGMAAHAAEPECAAGRGRCRGRLAGAVEDPRRLRAACGGLCARMRRCTPASGPSG
jgi:hypothetical protein